MGPHEDMLAGKSTLHDDLTSESTHPTESLRIAPRVVSTSHRTGTTLTGQEFAKIPPPRPRTGLVWEERVDPRPQPMHMRLVYAPAKKPRGKAVGGGRDPRISCA